MVCGHPTWGSLVVGGLVARMTGPACTRVTRSRDWLGGAALIALTTGLAVCPVFLFEGACWRALDTNTTIRRRRDSG